MSSATAPITANEPVYSTTDYSYSGTAYLGNKEYQIIKYASSGTYAEMRPINRIHNSEGYAENSIFSPNYYYFRLDHLGNNREVWLANTDSTVQRTQYYPSGLPWASNSIDNPGAQPYKYNGKEFIEMHGLDEFDSNARFLYPAIMRTTTIDPLSEFYYDISPYAWCANNPINIVDPSGMELEMDWIENDDGNAVWTENQDKIDKAKKDKKYIGKTVDGTDQFGNFVYGDQYGSIWYSKPLSEVTVQAKMPDHIRDLLAGIKLEVYDGQNAFIDHPITQGMLFLMTLAFTPELMVARTVASSTSASFYTGLAVEKGATTTLKAAKGVTNLIPEGKLANHLFKGAGKLADNPANRTLIQKIANGKPLGVDAYGKSWYMGLDDAGKSIYIYTQNGVVKGAGYATMTPAEMIAKYGLK